MVTRCQEVINPGEQIPEKLVTGVIAKTFSDGISSTVPMSLPGWVPMRIPERVSDGAPNLSYRRLRKVLMNRCKSLFMWVSLTPQF